ncbi:transglycosylase domain-containing protein [Spongiactinospora sp. TRM90649]|uniref:transglycosylase domain-containing protein n=1 Tax=Spongiactinospora sp. TRM90649 TaxID=3031114 RepID=UPI0023F91C77|nr:transglycosylase domain-containing protein [Spongiactinospora sp. TRM90649]MDF5754847.1 transglycosylase domain-containing protein [Spongiactinospora sp. TRM90649]
MQAQAKDRSSLLANVLRLIIAAAVAGMLAAAVALPAVGGVGMTVKSATEGLQLTPEELDEPPLPEKSVLLDRDGDPIAQFYFENRESIKLDQVAPVMREAIVAIEDFRFYEHGPIDLEGTVRALAKNLSSGGVTQGGSSITQQYVKLVLFNKAETKEERAAATATTYSRKLTELRFAMALEKKYTKDQILERYLNISYFGAGAYGVQAASRRFFDKPASKLTLAEAATLAGAVQNPSVTDPNVNKASRKRLLDRRNVVIDRMYKIGKITPQEAAEARAKPLGWKDVDIPGGCQESPYPYFCLYVQYEILTNPAFGKSDSQRRRLLRNGGLTIRTTLDPKMQRASEKAIARYVDPTDDPVASQAMVVPGSGEIRAMAASRKFGASRKKKEISYNLPADRAHGGGAGFQAGSTFKVFTLLTALDQGMKVDDGLKAPNGYIAPSVSSFKNCKGRNVGEPTAPHPISNSSEGGGGFKSLSTGTWGSVNTFFVALEEKVGLCETVTMAKELGVKRADGTPLREFQTFTLGINEMDPVTLSNAYATIAARGEYCRPIAVTEVRDRYGKATKHKPKCKQVLDEEVADAASHILSGVFTKGTMSGVGGIGRDAAGKTGTTDNYTAAWFAGYTPDLASAVSLGDPRGAFANDLTGVTIGGTTWGYVYGATISGPIWKYSMMEALKGTDPTSFTPLNMERFGGCSTACAPKPPKKEKKEGEDGDGDGDDGDGDDWEEEDQTLPDQDGGIDQRWNDDVDFGDPITPIG